MNSTHQEQISALMDDQSVTPSALDHLLDHQESVQTWARYHLIRDALQNEIQQDAILDISASVSMAVENEPAILAPNNLKRSKTMQSVVGFAMAASVFAVALLGWQQLQSPVAHPSQPAMELATNETQIAPVAKISAKPAVDEERARLEDMLITHTEAVSANGINLVMPYTRVVSARLELPAEQVEQDDKDQTLTDSDQKEKDRKEKEAKEAAVPVTDKE